MVARLLLALLILISPSESQEDTSEDISEDEDYGGCPACESPKPLADVYDLDSYRQRRLESE